MSGNPEEGGGIVRWGCWGRLSGFSRFLKDCGRWTAIECRGIERDRHEQRHRVLRAWYLQPGKHQWPRVAGPEWEWG